MVKLLAGILITVSLFLFPGLCNALDEWEPFIGTWEYRQSNYATESGYDSEGERLDIRRTGETIKGVYFGLEREGEHGLFYSATEVEELSFDRDGQISFIVPERKLYRERPLSLEAAKTTEGDSGFTRYSLQMTGIVENNRLVVRCRSRFGNCPDDEMIFKKALWKS